MCMAEFGILLKKVIERERNHSLKYMLGGMCYQLLEEREFEVLVCDEFDSVGWQDVLGLWLSENSKNQARKGYLSVSQTSCLCWVGLHQSKLSLKNQSLGPV